MNTNNGERRGYGYGTCISRIIFISSEGMEQLLISHVEANGPDGRKAEAMLAAHEQRSEVARLLAQINEEYESAQRGLVGLSYGTSQHQFITQKMERMGELHTQLHDIVGDVAIAMIADQLNAFPDQPVQ